MKNTLLALLCLTLFSCTQQAYFDFDEIDHYSINIDDVALMKLDKETLKSKLDSLKLNVITGYSPKDMSDLSFIDKLEEMGFKKSNVDTSKFASIRTIFTEKESIINESTTCETMYRNILIFRKNNKVVGTAKICFSCMQSDIKGTTADTGNFGQGGDFSKLEGVLRK